MTANHLLIYRLAELMLEKQQHVLAVDDLFEDEQIGEFVKSIQIDSPYQQMLLEDVLTETVKEHKLYVTFTVEGYFHYVLGEVIFQQAKGKGPGFLKNIIENNELNGSKEGVEQCLMRDVENDDLSRLMRFIDEGGSLLEVCSYPLAKAFTQHPLDKVDSEKEFIRNIIFEDLINVQKTKNLEGALINAFRILEQAQRLSILEPAIYLFRSYNVSKKFWSVWFWVNMIDHIHSNQLLQSILKEIDTFELSKQFTEDKIETFINVSRSFAFGGNIDKARDLFVLLDKHIKNDDLILNSMLKHLNGIISSLQGKFRESNECYAWIIENAESESDLRLIKLNYSAMNNMAFNFFKEGKVDEAKKMWERVLINKINIYGSYHASISLVLSNLAQCYILEGNIELSIECLKESLEIDVKCFGSNHVNVATTLGTLGVIKGKHLGDSESSLSYLSRARDILMANHGLFHEETLKASFNLGRLFEQINDIVSAKKVYNETLNILNKSDDLDDLKTMVKSRLQLLE